MNYIDLIERQLRDAIDAGDYGEIMRLGGIIDAFEAATRGVAE